CDYPDQRYHGYITKCGRMLTGQPAFGAAPFTRFEIRNNQKFSWPFDEVLKGTRNGIYGPFDLGPAPLFNGVGNNNLIGGYTMKELLFCLPGPLDAGRNLTNILYARPGVQNFADPTPVFMRLPCKNHLSRHEGITAGAQGEGAFTDF